MGSYRRVRILAAVLLVTAAPLAAAGWGVKGMWEPDTARDRMDGYMPQTPDQVAGGARKVYFNGYIGQGSEESGGATTSGNTHMNPNLVALGSSIAPFPGVAWALLGVWKDCNKDGFIGWGDQGLWEYKAELLSLPGQPGFSVCPNQGDIPTSFPFIENFIAPHNDGKWIHEFIAIGWRFWPDSVDLNPWALNDSGARVWADYGLPESALTVQCTVSPAPRGTFQSTGGTIAWSDCLTGYRATATINQAADAHAALNGLSFEDQPMGRQGESSSDLNIDNPWGTQEDASYTTFWDCSQPQTSAPRDPFWDGESGPTHQSFPNPLPAGDREYWVNLSTADGRFGVGVSSIFGVYLNYLNVSAVGSPSAFNPGGSPSGTVNETQQGYGNTQCGRGDATGPGNSMTPYTLEGDVDVDVGKRDTSDFVLHYEQGRSRAGPHALTGRGAPPDGGVKATGKEQCFSTGVLYNFYCYDGLWGDRRATDADAFLGAKNPWVNREALAPSAVTYITYYAFVSPAAVSAYGLGLPVATGSYGSEGCARVPATFECDPANWWPGNSVPTTSWLRVSGDNVPYGVTVGQAYQLRDVDCYDQGVKPLRDQGLGWGALTGTRCV